MATVSLWSDADERADRLRVDGAAHEPFCWWGECWCRGSADVRLPDPWNLRYGAGRATWAFVLRYSVMPLTITLPQPDTPTPLT